MQDSNPDDKTRSHIQLQKDIQIGHYRIIEKIGAGGMGEVYLAEDTKLHRKVALKFLPLHLCQDPECRARFTREAEAAAQLDHPNIVAVHEVGEYQGRPFFSMQHVEGQSLKEVLSGKALPLDRILAIGIQICEGLQAAHEKGITHRDIKPSNILIDSHGRARIVDFGLASVMGTDHLTKTGSTLGTIGYMSPEQVRGDKVDHRTDLFSFGVVLYEMIAGQAPFKTDSEAATLHAITDTEPELLARFRRGMPAEWQTITDKALQKDVRTRYQHADDFATDLQRLTNRTGTQPAAKLRKRQVAWSSLLIVGLLAAILVLRPWRIMIKPSEEAKAATKRVVVVPFKNETGDPSLDPLGKMVADWTTQSLLQTGLAEVVPPEASLGLNANRDVRSVAKATGTSIIVTGSYYRIGDSIQFQAQVSNAEEKLLQAIEPLYAANIRVMDGVELVRQRVLGALALVLDDRLLGSSARSGRPPKYEAYQEHMLAFEAFNNGDYDSAIHHADKAYTIDSSFLDPLLGICIAYGNLGRSAEEDSVIQLLLPRRARLTTLQQLKLDYCIASVAGDHAKALDAMRSAAKLAPRSPFTYNLALAAMNVNRPREAIEALKTLDLENRWLNKDDFGYWYNLVLAYYFLGEYDHEIEIIQQARKRHPQWASTFYWETTVYAAKGNTKEIDRLLEECASLPVNGGVVPAWVLQGIGMDLRRHGYEEAAMKLIDRAIEWYQSKPADEIKPLRFAYGQTLWAGRRWKEARSVHEELAKETPDDINHQAVLGCLAARLGDRETALRISKWLQDQKRPYLYGQTLWPRACIAAILGDKVQALALLRENFAKGGTYNWLNYVDHDLESLWNYPPYIELMKPKG